MNAETKAAIAWYLAELTKMGITRLMESGQYDTLTQEQAEAELNRMALAMPASLPSAQDLVNEGRNSTEP